MWGEARYGRERRRGTEGKGEEGEGKEGRGTQSHSEDYCITETVSAGFHKLNSLRVA